MKQIIIIVALFIGWTGYAVGKVSYDTTTTTRFSNGAIKVAKVPIKHEVGDTIFSFLPIFGKKDLPFKLYSDEISALKVGQYCQVSCHTLHEQFVGHWWWWETDFTEVNAYAYRIPTGVVGIQLESPSHGVATFRMSFFVLFVSLMLLSFVMIFLGEFLPGLGIFIGGVEILYLIVLLATPFLFPFWVVVFSWILFAIQLLLFLGKFVRPIIFAFRK